LRVVGTNRRPSCGVDEVSVAVTADRHAAAVRRKGHRRVGTAVAGRLDLPPNLAVRNTDQHHRTSVAVTTAPATGFIHHGEGGAVDHEFDIRKGPGTARMGDVFVNHGEIAGPQHGGGVVRKGRCHIHIVGRPIHGSHVGVVPVHQIRRRGHNGEGRGVVDANPIARCNDDFAPIGVVVDAVGLLVVDEELLREIGVGGGPTVVEIRSPVTIAVRAAVTVDRGGASRPRAIVDGVIHAVAIGIHRRGVQRQERSHHQCGQHQSKNPAFADGLIEHDFPSPCRLKDCG